MNNTTFDIFGIWNIKRCDFSGADSRFDAFVYISMAIIALFENITISACYFRYRPLRNATNFFLISLTASDVLVATLSIPFSFGVYLCQLRPPIDKRYIGDLIYLICDMLPSILSIYSLSLVALDRMLAVTNPYFYARHVTQRTAAIAVASVWLFVTFLVSLILIFERRQFTLFIVIMSYIFPVTVMLISYMIIGFVAKQHAKEITKWEKTGFRLKIDSRAFPYNDDMSPSSEDAAKRFSLSVQKDLITLDFNIQDTREWIKQNRPKYLWRELKAAFRLLLLLGTFIVAWTPFMALNIEYYRCRGCHIDFTIVKYFKMLHYSNSAFNPLLFILLNKRWRVAFVMALCRSKLSPRSSEAKINSLRDW